MSAPGVARCRLCAWEKSIETDVDTAAGRSTAFEWALHFAAFHPTAPRPVSQHVDVAPRKSSNRGEGSDA